MCGIAGFIGRERIPADRIRSALDLMRNRGPDHRDFREIGCGDSWVTLLHSRLAILDLDSRSNQPFTAGESTLVFNGEIYNYLEVKERLRARGVAFRTESDTEVLLQAYLDKGLDGLRDLEGMWSFALFDAVKRRLVLSRDRFGEKPLYILRTSAGIYFGSEPKAIEALSGIRLRPNMRQLLRYLVNGYRSLYKTGDTFFEGLEEVPIATSLVIDPELRVKAARFWTPACNPVAMSLEESVEGFRERLLHSISIRLRADVPMAFCLSGGVDSASIASVAAKVHGYRVHAFSILDPDGRYNEEENIRATLDDLGCPSTLIRLPRPGALERLQRLVDYHDGPLATISYFVHSYLSEEISGQGFKVAFSGTGADELVTGYYDHFNLHHYEMRGAPEAGPRMEEWKRWIAPIVRNPHLGRPDLYFDNPGFRDHIYLHNDEFAMYLKAPFAEGFTETRYCDSLLRNRMMNEMFNEGTRVILHEDDLNSMLHSVENRSPFLDTALFEFSYSIPAAYLIRNGYAKYVLREAMKGILNEQVRTDRKKKGFNASVHSILDLSDPRTREAILEPSPVYDLVDRSRISALMDVKPFSDGYNKFFFSFLNVKMFLDRRA